MNTSKLQEQSALQIPKGNVDQASCSFLNYLSGSHDLFLPNILYINADVIFIQVLSNTFSFQSFLEKDRSEFSIIHASFLCSSLYKSGIWRLQWFFPVQNKQKGGKKDTEEILPLKINKEDAENVLDAVNPELD